jgi:dihydroflavonol-4-reductase
MKILVTGGNGFLGSWIVKALIDRGDQVRVLHRTTSDISSIRGLPYESALGDVTDMPSLLKATDGVEAVIHAAAIIAYAPKDRPLMETVNVGGTENVAKACIKNKVKRLVHTSSVVAVGGSLKPEILNEDSPYEMSPFGFGYYDTKFQAEQVIKKYVKEARLDAVIVNPAVMFGPGDAVKSSRKTHLKVAAGKVPVYSLGGCNVMDVDDAVTGHLRALERGRTGERYILGGENVTVKQLFEWLAQYGGHKAPAIPLPNFVFRSAARLAGLAARAGIKLKISSDSLYIATMFHWYDTSKAHKELGITPSPAAKAVEKSIAWCFENGYLDRH